MRKQARDCRCYWQHDRDQRRGGGPAQGWRRAQRARACQCYQQHDTHATSQSPPCGQRQRSQFSGGAAACALAHTPCGCVPPLPPGLSSRLCAAAADGARCGVHALPGVRPPHPTHQHTHQHHGGLDTTARPAAVAARQAAKLLRGPHRMPASDHAASTLPLRSSQFEVDFISLSYCNAASDLYSCRALLDSLGMQQTKIIAKAGAGVGPLA